MQPSSIFCRTSDGQRIKELLINPDYVTSYNSGVCSSDATLSGATIPPDVKQNIDKLLPAYQKAAEQTGVRGNCWPPSTIVKQITTLLKIFRQATCSEVASQYADYTGARPSTIEASAVMAAQQLISKAAAGSEITNQHLKSDSAAIKDALFGYKRPGGCMLNKQLI